MALLYPNYTNRASRMADDILTRLAAQWKPIATLASGGVALVLIGWTGHVLFGQQVGIPAQMAEVYEAVVTDSLSSRVTSLQRTANANFNAIQSITAQNAVYEDMLCNRESLEVMGLRRQIQCEQIQATVPDPFSPRR